ncbi:MAG: hypothetical protein DCF32_08465 [Leptolyngbya sp.]|nr:MAG: hypothetical protein DCF32_08465 [Leptolyngbya sp.]
MDGIDLLADPIFHEVLAPANSILMLVSYKFRPKPPASNLSTDFCLRDSLLRGAEGILIMYFARVESAIEQS